MKTPDTLWIVVADAARARIFRRDPGALVEVMDLVHPESRQPSRDLVSDKGGSAFGSAGSGRRAGTGPEVGAHEREHARAADELATQLREHHRAGAFTSLVLVAAPRFLGRLRGAIDATTAKAVTAELAKDYTHHTVDEITRHLDTHVGGGSA